MGKSKPLPCDSAIFLSPEACLSMPSMVAMISFLRASDERLSLTSSISYTRKSAGFLMVTTGVLL